MENKKLIVFFAMGFSVVFSILYYFLFTMSLSDHTIEKRTLYMNQIGLYEKADSIASVKESLKRAGLVGYELKQGDLTAVVCSVGTDKKVWENEQKKLKELKYNYIAKKVTVEDPEIARMIDNQQYEKALERIGK